MDPFNRRAILQGIILLTLAVLAAAMMVPSAHSRECRVAIPASSRPSW